uniref:Uncharacterized protein n=1 Tax=Paraburkholderia sprentiae WSM5005 TaxID=754502 RepID=A0A1I9YFT4_9BURK
MTVAIITTDELFGCERMFRIERQLNALIDTMIMTATSAPIGICFTQGHRKTTTTAVSYFAAALPKTCHGVPFFQVFAKRAFLHLHAAGGAAESTP